MYIVISVVLILYLLGLSILDIRSQKVPTLLIWSFIGLLVLEVAINNQGRVTLSILGGAVGLLMLIISKLTKEALGYGDGLLVLGLGISLGLWKILWLLMIAFFGAAIFAIGLLVLKRAKRKSTLPFIPFICASYIILFVFEIM